MDKFSWNHIGEALHDKYHKWICVWWWVSIADLNKKSASLRPGPRLSLKISKFRKTHKNWPGMAIFNSDLPLYSMRHLTKMQTNSWNAEKFRAVTPFRNDRQTDSRAHGTTKILVGAYGGPLLWRHNGRDSVSHHQLHGCLPKRLLRRRSKKTLSAASLAFVRGTGTNGQ